MKGHAKFHRIKIVKAGTISVFCLVLLFAYGNCSRAQYTLLNSASTLSSESLFLALGYNHSCALSQSGVVKCWGNNFYGQLGNSVQTGKHSIPETVEGLESAVQIASGDDHVCTLTSSGSVYCWGSNTKGQLAQPLPTAGGGVRSSYTPILIAGLSDVKAISAGAAFTCAILSNRFVKCWGSNLSGALGASTAAANSIVPLEVFNLGPIKQIATGGYHACALTDLDKLMCWGLNSSQQVGIEYPDAVYAPVEIPLAEPIIKIGLGSKHSCYVTKLGKIKCWGSNQDGQFGVDPLTSITSYPVENPLISGVQDLSAGHDFNCAITADQVLKCWGKGAAGEVGYGEFKSTWIPQAVKLPPGTKSRDVATTANGYHACAMDSNMLIRCWGDNSSGNSGGSDTVLESADPIDVQF